ncbi:MAG: WbuC family cupin fold metalloprotein, partial [Thermodesulfobacteriota bacterium]
APPKVELFIILRGRGAAVSFNAKGEVIESIVMEPLGNAPGVEFPPGMWHTLLSLEEGTVFFEVKDGPYDASTDKEFAPWAPEESEKEATLAYLKKLKTDVLNKENL